MRIPAFDVSLSQSAEGLSGPSGFAVCGDPDHHSGVPTSGSDSACLGWGADRGACQRQQGDHFGVLELRETAIELPDRQEVGRCLKAHDLIDFLAQPSERLACCNRDGQDDTLRIAPPDVAQSGKHC